jgi:hypothetical protein
MFATYKASQPASWYSSICPRWVRGPEPRSRSAHPSVNRPPPEQNAGGRNCLAGPEGPDLHAPAVPPTRDRHVSEPPAECENGIRSPESRQSRSKANPPRTGPPPPARSPKPGGCRSPAPRRGGFHRSPAGPVAERVARVRGELGPGRYPSPYTRRRVDREGVRRARAHPVITAARMVDGAHDDASRPRAGRWWHRPGLVPKTREHARAQPR